MYDFSHDFVLNDLDDFAVEKNDPGVGQGPARLELFQPTLRWRRQRDLARPSEVHGFPGIRRHGSLRARLRAPPGGRSFTPAENLVKKKRFLLLKFKIQESIVLPNGVCMPYV